MKKWLTSKIYWIIGGLVSTIPAVDFVVSGFLDEIYAFIIAGLVTWLAKLGQTLNK